eukprot:m.1111277 g.1111277  ORF g.1111277 m.1111277 type:complete len:219 (-) comp24361_c0_seq27:2373-3029(-)
MRCYLVQAEVHPWRATCVQTRVMCMHYGRVCCVCATVKSDVRIGGQAVVLNVSDAAVAAVDDAREMARLPRFADALQFSYMDFGKWSEFLVNKWDLTADDLPAVVVLRPESQEYAVLATGENAVRHEALGTYGLKTDVIIERLDAVVANNVTWSGRRTALDRLRRSIYTAVEQFIVVFGALQAEHPMLVHGSVASTLMLFVVLLRTCFAGSSGKPKKD